jgi:hypothetical protein
VPRGWRTESSGGAEIIVPANWTINEWGCGRETDRPTVVRGMSGPTLACGVRDSPIKSVAILDSFAPPGREDAYRATSENTQRPGAQPTPLPADYADFLDEYAAALADVPLAEDTYAVPAAGWEADQDN